MSIKITNADAVLRALRRFGASLANLTKMSQIRGGMGEVYEADDINLNCEAALRFLPDALRAILNKYPASSARPGFWLRRRTRT